MATARERDAMRRRVVIADRTICHHCKRAGLTAADHFCPGCGFPQGGTEQQQYAFIVKKRKVRSEIEDNERMVSKARWFLFVVAALNMINISFNDRVVVASSTIVSLVFVGLGIWSERAPFPALLTAFILYVSLQLLIAVIDLRYFLWGLIFKIVIASAMLYGMYSAKAIERLRSQQ